MARAKQIVATLFFVMQVIACTVLVMLCITAPSDAQIPEACMAGLCAGIGPGMSKTPDYSSGSYDSGAFRRNHPDVDTPVNRELANGIYEAVFTDINRALTTKGKAAASQLIQHEERNQHLTDLVGSISNQSYIVAERTIASSIRDARLYINGGHMVGVHAISDARWKDSVSKAQEDVDAKASDTSEYLFLKNCSESPNCYGPDDEKAAELVIAVYREKEEKLRAANAAAEAARREEIRIAEVRAVEAARVAKLEADEVARIAHARQLQAEADAPDALTAKLTKFLQMGAIPEECLRKYGNYDQVDLDTTVQVTGYVFPPTAKIDPKHNSQTILPAGVHLETSGPDSFDWPSGADSGGSTDRYVPVKFFNKLGSPRYYVEASKLKFCSEKRKFF